MSWTDERIDRLKQLWEGGQTASQIAEELGNVTRNAVIGKAHRLGLQARPSPVGAAREQAAATPVSAPASAPAASEAEPTTDVASAAAAPETPEPILVEEPAQAAQAPEPGASEEPAPVPGVHPRQPVTTAAPSATPPPPSPTIRSVGPGGFIRQGPGDQQPPIPPAPPRRLVPAKPSADMASKTSLLELSDKICKWPLGHPGEPDFHFCGKPINPGFPYCLDHCSVAYQAQLPRRDRRPPPPLPYGGPRVR